MKFPAQIMTQRLWLLTCLVVLILGSLACLGIAATSDRSAPFSASTAPAKALAQATSAGLPAPESTTRRQVLPAALTPSIEPSASPTVTTTPLPTLTPTPSLHPMMIAALRETEYPGSDIVLVEKLEPGSNYDRFYASYESEGLTIYGLLTIPQGEMPASGWPAIVFNHGYIPPLEYRTTERYIAYVNALASNGYVVFRIDYRGHDRSEGEASGAYGDPGYTVDVLNAVASLKRFPQVDPQRIGMWGHSMGGFLTLRAMVISPDIKAGVIWAGVVGSYQDILTRWRRRGAETSTPVPAGPRSWRGRWAEEFGSPEENPDFWNAISATTYLTEISGPLQLHHGTADTSVPPVLSQLLYEQMLAVGKPAEYYEYEGDNHNISESFGDAMYRTIKFFDQYVKGNP
jgi:dienelactone hydrolase